MMDTLRRRSLPKQAFKLSGESLDAIRGKHGFGLPWLLALLSCYNLRLSRVRAARVVVVRLWRLEAHSQLMRRTRQDRKTCAAWLSATGTESVRNGRGWDLSAHGFGVRSGWWADSSPHNIQRGVTDVNTQSQHAQPTTRRNHNWPVGGGGEPPTDGDSAFYMLVLHDATPMLLAPCLGASCCRSQGAPTHLSS